MNSDVCDFYIIQWPVIFAYSFLLKFIQGFKAVDELAEDAEFFIERWLFSIEDEKLRAIFVSTRVRH